MALEHLEPQKAFHYFEEICGIPHGSGNEQHISDYLLGFAEKRGLCAARDGALNVVVKKPGTPGYENAPPVILQGHMDMVCGKHAGVAHDFLKDPIRPVVEGGFVKASGTTLGADNGAGMALALAVLDSDGLSHPPLEALFTTGEETGMFGAAAFDGGMLSGTRLINLDSEEEGVFTASCAGGMRVNIKLSARYEKAPEEYIPMRLNVGGLTGGHSGIDIDKQRANANILAARVTGGLMESLGVCVSGFNGGAQPNSIPRECVADLLCAEKDAEAVKQFVAKREIEFKKEYFGKDYSLTVNIERTNDAGGYVLTKQAADNMISAILLSPNGVQRMSAEGEGLVETSNNVGMVNTNDEEIVISCSLRSSVLSQKYFVCERLRALARVLGGSAIVSSDYPAWEYRHSSPLRQAARDVYSGMFQSEPKVAAIHAGLECGLLGERLNNPDMISIGPDIFGAHSPEERMSIASFTRTWGFLLKLLERLG